MKFKFKKFRHPSLDRGARAGGPGGGSLAPDLAPVWRQDGQAHTTDNCSQTDRRQTHEHERRQRRTLHLVPQLCIH
eukprot:scaffold875_cov120-Isochrysis_galbana.AAC.4